jgi:hypothetical protein
MPKRSLVVTLPDGILDAAGKFHPTPPPVQRASRFTETRRETIAEIELTPEEKLVLAVHFASLLAERPRQEVVGMWLWLDFDGKPEEATRDAMKAHGFRWSKTRSRWYFAAVPSGRGKNMSMDDIRTRHGSAHIN